VHVEAAPVETPISMKRTRKAAKPVPARTAEAAPTVKPTAPEAEGATLEAMRKARERAERRTNRD
jgi:hypothetical protein